MQVDRRVTLVSCPFGSVVQYESGRILVRLGMNHFILDPDTLNSLSAMLEEAVHLIDTGAAVEPV